MTHAPNCRALIIDFISVFIQHGNDMLYLNVATRDFFKNVNLVSLF